MSENTAEILNGAEVANAIKNDAAAEVRNLIEKFGVKPGLAVVRVGEDPASAVYVGNKVKTCEEVGINSEHFHVPVETTEDELLKIVCQLNGRDDVDGILVQLPLPNHIDEKKVLETIDPAKDVDGFHPINVGRLASGQNSLAPCTPAGIIVLLKYFGIEIKGQRAVVIGRSNIVGKPMAMLLLENDATVTICHSRTRDLAAVASQADILVAAIGRAGFVTAEHIKPGATVIDVGMNKVTDADHARELFGGDELEKRLNTITKRGFTLVGDVNPRDAKAKAGKFAPVPGGVGLLTVAMLMRNTVDAAKMRRQIGNA